MMQMIAGTIRNAVNLDMLTRNWEQKMSRIEGPDGSTSVFIAGRDSRKISLKQRIQRFINRSRRMYI